MRLPRLSGHSLAAAGNRLADAGNNIATSVSSVGTCVNTGFSTIGTAMLFIGTAMLAIWSPLSARGAIILYLTLAFLAMEIILLPFFLPLLTQPGRAVQLPGDHDSLRDFFYTTAKDRELLKIVLKRTEGKDLSNPSYDRVRAAIERCRLA